MRRVLMLVAAGLSFAAMVAAAAEPLIVPKIAPGYLPAEARDEQGIWMELEDYEQNIRRSALLVGDRRINAYVRDAMCRVAGEYCADLRIYVIRNPNFNASMTANGIVQVWTGLLLRVSSEDEMAAVLGHELAHFTQLHMLEQLRSAKAALTAGSVFDMGVTLLTGYSIPVGQLAAAASLTSHSRDDETEADILGAEFMATAGYDPHAAANVWKMMINEESMAVVKREKSGWYFNTHPSSANRIVALHNFAARNYEGTKPDPHGRQRHVDILNEYYMMLMEDQVDTNRFGRTEAMLERHRQIGVREQLVNFFRGEICRQRNEPGDLDASIIAYKLAIQGDFPVPEAYLNLGYIYLKLGELEQRQYNFRKYLELEPEADDRAMIEFYLEDS
jgi:predicted Zn-dependent protease